MELVLLHAIAERFFRNAQELRRSSPIPARRLERFKDELALHLVQVDSADGKIHTHAAGSDLDRGRGRAGR